MPPDNPPPADDATPTEQPTPGAGGAGDVDAMALAVAKRIPLDSFYSHYDENEREVAALIATAMREAASALIAERDALRATVDAYQAAASELPTHYFLQVSHRVANRAALARGPAADGSAP